MIDNLQIFFGISRLCLFFTQRQKTNSTHYNRFGKKRKRKMKVFIKKIKNVRFWKTLMNHLTKQMQQKSFLWKLQLECRLYQSRRHVMIESKRSS